VGCLTQKIMNKTQVENLRNWFYSYTARFPGADPYTDENIRIKIMHTEGVCRNILAISQFLNLDEEKQNLAEAVGLLHDIGRFEQLKKYKTFNDSSSENHSEIGARVIRDEKILDDLAPHEQEIILASVLYHSSLTLPANEKPGTLLFMKMIRDADKLDILEVLTTYYHSGHNESNPALDLDLPFETGFSEAVIEDLQNRKCVNLEHTRTAVDFKLLQASWIYDINFPYSHRYIRDHRYIEKLMEALPPSAELNKIFNSIIDDLNRFSR